MVPFAVLVPLSVLVFGLVNKFVDGPVGLFISLICLFVNGLGVSSSCITWSWSVTDFFHKVEMAFGPCAAYLIDVMHSRSAESLAANKCDYLFF